MPADHHFPRFHVRPPRGYVNDPNGPVYVDGRWHLYFQYVSDTPRRGAVAWGHASSADLVTWQYHRPAISPDPDGIDRDGCWSGNAVVTDDGLTAFYSGFRQGHPYQSVVAATSVDGGASFGPPVPVVADPSPEEQVKEFRDPFVWQHGEGWRMVVGSGRAGGPGTARLYASTDLTSWTYEGPFAELPRTRGADYDTGEMWECPQVLTFDGQDALLISQYSWTSGGTNDVFSLVGETVHRVDLGTNFYAASAMRSSPVGPLVWGWVTEGRTQEWTVEADWSGMLSLPRSVSLASDGRLASVPVEALTALRNQRVESLDDLPAQLEVSARVAGSARLTLHCGPDERLVVEVADGTVTVDRDAASSDPRAHGGRFTFAEPGEELTLRWFLDGSVSELFTGSGRSSTVRFYPTTPPPWRLEVEGDASVEAWTLGAD
ncbi:glycoside hydrolase family 32 protein [Tenggerimyces flavus]|uniref:beta-fructofuranosidase n=1 Tax=Tenggerimyces flavus TaxID=1708749 RepID=A0ABV7YP42_9ACTN|nr:glycoside hydrolase family 32 protein [Tenggerimyces flavus]MBM7785920.1 beta-fructofuranosidase [Tenggerimyces flavus]